jgi:hypothetical protein
VSTTMQARRRKEHGWSGRDVRTRFVHRVLLLVFIVLGVVVAKDSDAQGSRVPTNLQAALVAKVAGFDRNFAARANGRVRVLLVKADGNPESSLAATEMLNALAALPTIGDLPHDQEVVSFTSGSALADVVKAKHITIVYFGPGFTTRTTEIRDAFTDVNVLTVGALAEYVPAGIVLGFDLVSGKPKLVVHLPQARRQHVEFQGAALGLMKVVE